MTERTHSPASNGPSNDREFAVILEEINKQFKTFGDGLSGIRQHIDRMEPQLNQLVEDVDLIKLVSRKNTDEIQEIQMWARKLSSDHDALQLVVKLFRDDVKGFAKRLDVVETKIGL